MENYERKISEVRKRVKLAAERSGRSVDEITLIAVSKTQMPLAIKTAYQYGIRHFGENRITELEDKVLELSNLTDISWDFIGRLQSRQCKNVAKYAHLFHAVDRVLIAKILSDRLENEGRKLKVFVQVNISGEETKAGFECNEWETNDLQKEALLTSINEIANLPNLEIQGLMTMAPFGTPASVSRTIFKRTHKLLDWINHAAPQYNFKELSMGMSGDFEEAIEEGATFIRVGGAIFGGH